MIVTRQRKKKRRTLPILLPLVAIAALTAALVWPPSHNVIVNGPLKPFWAVTGNAASVVERPLTFARQQQQIADLTRQKRDLTGQVEQQRQAKADADTRAQQLAQKLNAVAAQPKPAPPVPAPVRTAAPAGLGAPGAPGAGGAAAANAPTEDEKRLAATWAAMEPEKAAAVVQKLSDAEVTRILAAMDPESAAGILNALPANVAARLSRAGAQVSPAGGR